MREQDIQALEQWLSQWRARLVDTWGVDLNAVTDWYERFKGVLNDLRQLERMG